MPKADAPRFKTLIEPHLDALFRAAYRLTRNRADAEDLVQDTCIRAHVRIAELNESQPVKAWLLRVLHNAFVDGARRARSSPIAGVDADLGSTFACSGQSPEESAYTSQREERLHRAWLTLDRGQRALLALRAEGYTLVEIGAITGLAADALNMRLYRARRSLARRLKEDETPARAIRVEVAK